MRGHFINSISFINLDLKYNRNVYKDDFCVHNCQNNNLIFFPDFTFQRLLMRPEWSNNRSWECWTPWTVDRSIQTLVWPVIPEHSLYRYVEERLSLCLQGTIHYLSKHHYASAISDPTVTVSLSRPNSLLLLSTQINWQRRGLSRRQQHLYLIHWLFKLDSFTSRLHYLPAVTLNSRQFLSLDDWYDFTWNCWTAMCMLPLCVSFLAQMKCLRGKALDLWW